MSTATDPAPDAAIANAAVPLLSVRKLCKFYPIRGKGLLRKQEGWVKAVNEVSFDLLPGRTLGLVGESGCGKTTTARSILRAVDPTSGQVLFRTASGSVVDLATFPAAALKPLRTEMQMIFQDPFSSLNPRMTVEQIVAEPLVIHRRGDAGSRREAVIEMLRKVGLNPAHLTRYPHEFSGGQRQRIGIARALILRPRLVVCDEAVSALDVSVQAQVINLLMDLQEEFQLTYIFVAHDLSVVRHIADEVAVMYAGRLVEYAPCAELFANPKHPYTQALLAAAPVPDPVVERTRPRRIIKGELPSPLNPPAGCVFHPRCPLATEECKKAVPESRELSPGHKVACIHA
jgi:oligopeptide/dipeptide ABC transporter ATP-binding protein